jgi:positive regulator of sigma E activity
MSLSEGMVVKIHEDGRADVRIQEQNAGIIGAPDLNVCHCASPGSIIVTQALNRANALAGDRVCLEQPSWAIMKNVLVLVLVPLLCLLAGIIIGMALYHARFLSASGAIFVPAFIFLLGLGSGLIIYKKNFKHSEQVIIHIIETRGKS